MEHEPLVLLTFRVTTLRKKVVTKSLLFAKKVLPFGVFSLRITCRVNFCNVFYSLKITFVYTRNCLPMRLTCLISYPFVLSRCVNFVWLKGFCPICSQCFL